MTLKVWKTVMFEGKISSSVFWRIGPSKWSVKKVRNQTVYSLLENICISFPPHLLFWLIPPSMVWILSFSTFLNTLSFTPFPLHIVSFNPYLDLLSLVHSLPPFRYCPISTLSASCLNFLYSLWNNGKNTYWSLPLAPGTELLKPLAFPG